MIKYFFKLKIENKKASVPKTSKITIEKICKSNKMQKNEQEENNSKDDLIIISDDEIRGNC